MWSNEQKTSSSVTDYSNTAGTSRGEPENGHATAVGRQFHSAQRTQPVVRQDILISNTIDEVIQASMNTGESNLGESHNALAEKQSKTVAIYEEMISSLPEWHCSCCYRFLFIDQKYKNNAENEATEFCMVRNGGTVCCTCRKKLKNGTIPSRSHCNNLHVDPVPDVLKNLNFLERRFVCKMQTYMTLLKLGKGNQYAQKGLAIHFMSEPNEICCVLPRTPVNSGIVCIAENFKGYVRPSGIYAALINLKANHPRYHNVAIDRNMLLFKEGENGDQTDIEDNSITAEDFEEIAESGTVAIDYKFPSLTVSNATHLPWIHKAPTSFFEIKHTEIMAFPWLFPKGNSDIDASRQVKITLLDYLQSRFLHKDNRFRCDIGYLMTAVNRYEQSRLTSLVDLYLNGVKQAFKGDSSASTGSICSKTDAVTAGDLKQISSHHLNKNSMLFMKSIRGTSQYWKEELYNLLARAKCLGPPTVFLTASIDDMGWPELQEILKFDLGFEYTSAQDAVRKDPVMVAMYAERKLHELLKFIKKEKIFGEVTDFCVRKEWQSRGSVHFHIFFWIKDAPSLQKGSLEKDILAFINKCISTEIPDQAQDPELHELVKTRQIHNHTGTCKLIGQRKKSVECRFFYPRRVCENTRLLHESDRKNAKHQFYETKRSEKDIFVNAYNPQVLRHHRANMDIQIVNGDKGLIYYVLDYIAKAEPPELRSALMKTMEELDEIGKLTQRARMFKLGFCMLKTRQMCAQEAAYRICHLPMVESSRSIVKLNTSTPMKRYRKAKPRQVVQGLPDNSTEVFEDNMLILYRDRPKSLESLSLFKFASWYEKCSETSAGALPSLSGNRYAKKNKKFSCVRSSFSNFSSDDYYFNLLIMHLPHRKDADILKSHETAQEAFLDQESLLDLDDLSNERLVDEVTDAAQRLLVANALNSPDLEDENDVMEEECFLTPENIDYEELLGGQCSASANHADELSPSEIRDMQATDLSWHNMNVNLNSIGSLHDNIKCLSIDQKRVLKYAHKIMFADKAQMKLYLGGNAGTGKTHLLLLFVQWCRLNAQKFPGHDPVIVCAPTGLAAKGINGRTLHSLFRIPFEQGATTDKICPPLKDKRSLDDIKARLKDKTILVIDELSMVSEKLLKNVNNRLQEIHENNKLFGGVSVLLTGDFLQLRPIKGRYAFFSKEIFSQLDILWLTKNVRQDGDKPWCTLLDNTRVGKVLDSDSSLINSRCFSSEDLEDVRVELRLYPKLKMVNAYNSRKQNELDPKCYEMRSTDVYGLNDLEAGCGIADCNLPKNDRDSGGLCRVLKLTKHSRVMLLWNFGEGLSNGDMGYVHDFELDRNGSVKKIFVHFDDANAAISFKDPNHDNAVGIEEIERGYMYRKRYMRRKQFPLMPAWAVSIHKAEGFTLNSAVVNISECFSAGQAYVALSRVKTAAGIFIENGPDGVGIRPSRVFADQRAMKEIMQLKAKFQVLKRQPWLKNYKLPAMINHI